MFKTILKIFLPFLVISILYLLLWPVSFDPVAFTPPPYPGLEGVFAKNEKLTAATHLLKGKGVGPEAIVVGKDGFLYTGYENGAILKFSKDGETSQEITNTGGRPLGMKFDAKGNLIVADGKKGLLSIDSLGKITILTDEVEGTKIAFADDLDITTDGIIYFSDASQRNHKNIELEVWELQATGRLLSYNTSTKTTKVELEDLRFANGVAIGPNDEYLLITETFGTVISKYWLKGTKKGTKEIWNNKLPGFPDNITYNDNGTFWLAIPNQRVIDLEGVYEKPFLRKVIARLPKFITGAKATPYGMVLGFDESGEVTRNLQDTKGRTNNITSVLEHEGDLYIGSLKMDAIAKIKTN